MRTLKLSLQTYCALAESTEPVAAQTLWSWDSVKHALAGSTWKPVLSALTEDVDVRKHVMHYLREFAPFCVDGTVFTFADEAAASAFVDDAKQLGCDVQHLSPLIISAVGNDAELAVAAHQHAGELYAGPEISDRFEWVDKDLPHALLTEGGFDPSAASKMLREAVDGVLSNDTRLRAGKYLQRLENFCRLRTKSFGVDRRLFEAVVTADLLPKSVLEYASERDAWVRSLVEIDQSSGVAASNQTPASGVGIGSSGQQTRGVPDDRGGVAKGQSDTQGGQPAVSQVGVQPDQIAPTEHVPSEEEGGPTGEVRLADGTVVPKAVLQKAAAQILRNVATQLENNTPGGQPAKPEAEPDAGGNEGQTAPDLPVATPEQEGLGGNQKVPPETPPAQPKPDYSGGVPAGFGTAGTRESVRDLSSALLEGVSVDEIMEDADHDLFLRLLAHAIRSALNTTQNDAVKIPLTRALQAYEAGDLLGLVQQTRLAMVANGGNQTPYGSACTRYLQFAHHAGPLNDEDDESEAGDMRFDDSEETDEGYSKKARSFIAYKMRKMKGEGKPQAQKVAIALSMAKKKGHKVPQLPESVDESDSERDPGAEADFWKPEYARKKLASYRAGHKEAIAKGDIGAAQKLRRKHHALDKAVGLTYKGKQKDDMIRKAAEKESKASNESAETTEDIVCEADDEEARRARAQRLADWQKKRADAKAERQRKREEVIAARKTKQAGQETKQASQGTRHKKVSDPRFLWMHSDALRHGKNIDKFSKPILKNLGRELARQRRAFGRMHPEEYEAEFKVPPKPGQFVETDQLTCTVGELGKAKELIFFFGRQSRPMAVDFVKDLPISYQWESRIGRDDDGIVVVTLRSDDGTYTSADAAFLHGMARRFGGSMAEREVQGKGAFPVTEALDVGQDVPTQSAASDFADVADMVRRGRRAVFELSTNGLVRLVSIAHGVNAKRTAKLITQAAGISAEMVEKFRQVADLIQKSADLFKEEGGVAVDGSAAVPGPAPELAVSLPAIKAQVPAVASNTGEEATESEPEEGTEEEKEENVDAVVGEAVRRCIETSIPDRIQEGNSRRDMIDAIYVACRDLRMNEHQLSNAYNILRQSSIIAESRLYDFSLSEHDYAVVAEVGGRICERLRDIRSAKVTETDILETVALLRSHGGAAQVELAEALMGQFSSASAMMNIA